ncbi:glycosyltransferase family 4 protein [Zoogloea sp.]|uniref:glycosyltransferase family 4 protein n=1 Tax=Zoogloea sp. TaxID=49181 RepID=UPI0035AE7B73
MKHVDGNRIGFVLLSNSACPLPSTRIAVLNLFPYLKAAGYDPQIVFDPLSASETPDVSGLAERVAEQGFGLIYFQKVHGPSVLAEMRALRAMGIPTVYGVCDRIDDEIVSIADVTVTVTEFLRQQHAAELHDRIHVVHDGIEHPEIQCLHRDEAGPSARLRAVLVTSSTLEAVPALGRVPRHVDLTVVGRYPENPTLKESIRGHLKRALNQPGLVRTGFQTRAWHPQRVYSDLLEADIGIIPVDTGFNPLPGRKISYWEVKSENRLTLKMALGLPVIASPVPAYLDIIQQGINGYIARSRAEWLDAIDALRDPGHRREVGAAARSSVLERFSMEAQARKLISVLESVSVEAALSD